MNELKERREPKNWDGLVKACHEANSQWWRDLHTGERIRRNPEELLALAISEISEALEGERKDKMDDKLPHRKMAEVEMADAVIRLCDFSGGLSIPVRLWGTEVPMPVDVFTENKAQNLFRIMVAITKIRSSGVTETAIAYSLELIVSYCEKYNLDLWGAIKEKMEFNTRREDHKREARLQQDGKKF